ncbi:glycosyltransferase family 2 protein [Marinoscillum sp. MHG1-6]|uniref:glycosyltransferase n=1 Tax=Marinoscillum sp. MHG1-6 TaxID=2959627 RepID=UPI00215724D7|nr:glycosyltransferase [Marinoscillum sp. MHG1-6]
MPKYSVVIPIYNRPDELQELLETLTRQTFSDFEIVVVEDGSTITSKHVVEDFESKLDIHYYVKENGGQGFARNYGYERCKGDYYIVFDSDCLIPEHYFQAVDDFLTHQSVDAFGGPDAAHQSFNTVQKAISHSMTSLFTTGGIRGNKKHVGEYHPRSFNMGICKKVFEETMGYLIPFMGEDLEFSTRIIKKGYSTALIPDAFVYHKRRTDLRKFYKQLKYFGRARINLTRFHPEQISIIHLFPLVFSLGLIASVFAIPILPEIGLAGVGCYAFYLLLVMVEGLFKTKSIKVALLSPIVTLIQFFGYGYGLVYEWFRKLRGINPNTKYIELY